MTYWLFWQLGFPLQFQIETTFRSIWISDSVPINFVSYSLQKYSIFIVTMDTCLTWHMIQLKFHKIEQRKIVYLLWASKTPASILVLFFLLGIQFYFFLRWFRWTCVNSLIPIDDLILWEIGNAMGAVTHMHSK